MKQFLTISFSFFCFISNLNSQNNTVQDFNLPEDTVLYANGIFQYNGETKELVPTEQAQYDFQNGNLYKEAKVQLIGDVKFASQKTYAYNADNELINITDSGGVVDGNISHEDLKITYEKSGDVLKLFRNGKSYINKYFDANGKLTKRETYDALSSYIYEKSFFKNREKTTKSYNSNYELTRETTEYLNKDNNPIVKVVFDPRLSYYNTVTSYTYDTNGNLETSISNKYSADNLKKNFVFFENGMATKIPETALIGKPEKTTYYNYTENTLWVAQIANKINASKEIEVRIRGTKSADGKMNYYSNQEAFMEFLDKTYQIIKSQTP